MTRLLDLLADWWVTALGVVAALIGSAVIFWASVEAGAIVFFCGLIAVFFDTLSRVDWP